MCQTKYQADSITNMNLRTIFSENLKFYRKRASLSQQQLSEKCDIATNYLSEIERGQKFPSIEMIERISNELNIPAYLLFLEGKELTNSELIFQKRNKEFSDKLLETISMLLKNYGLSD